jgi:hypothetical protein
MPNRTIIDGSQLENHQLTQLTAALKRQMLKKAAKISLKKYEFMLKQW